MKRPKLSLTYPDVALITECEGVFVVEMMRFIWPAQAREMAQSKAYRARNAA